MENSPKKSAREIEEEKEKLNEEPEMNEAPNQDDDTPKVSREHDFTHTHPTHAKHKNFGVDHEPGAAF
jgi:hypothetical protein